MLHGLVRMGGGGGGSGSRLIVHVTRATSGLWLPLFLLPEIWSHQLPKPTKSVCVYAISVTFL